MRRSEPLEVGLPLAAVLRHPGEAQASFDTPEFATISEMIRSVRVGAAAAG
ncbi:hypothetical protein [Arthrobacter burdickii]|uniref:Uncharacterized protein n=1 Tax=Arthrobacter burdickii TaxID=3035920 RepID=A0ABT8K1A3_9MICC|nr:hypothetical protein [Arthrobacter burdickii]MDN4611201.1 hypothetical protein [Arthrobacter burdickii]